MTDWIWTDENVARLRRLVAEGLSGGQIAQIFKVSRNTVIGKIARLGIKLANNPGGSGKGLSHARKTPYVPKPRLVKPSPKDADVERLAIEPVPVGPANAFPDGDTCRWIHGNPKAEWQCCAAPGYPWCEHHATRMHVKGSAAKATPATAPNWSVPKRRAA